jgi:hypothetical protein
VLTYKDGAIQTTPSAWDRIDKPKIEIPTGE